MPYYNPYRYRSYWRRKPKRRFRFRQWRPRRTFQRTYRRRRTVRRRRRFRKYNRKLTKLTLKQFQPEKIKKCKIKGFIQLFGAGKGRISNNFTLYKESTVPTHEPGGGGWGIQQFTLGNLYVQAQYLMNYWTKSNKGLNLCRFLGTKVILYRQQETDYIFNYEIEPPYQVTKYYYNSFHPIKMLQYNKRIIVPSMKTMPHKRKPYIKRHIKPPKEMINKWYFQEHFSNYPLIQFAAISCSLNNMFQSTQAISNNISLYTLNTRFFQNCNFTQLIQANWGYTPKPGTYIYGIQQPQTPWNSNLGKHVTYLGNTLINDAGDEIAGMTKEQYGLAHWGNPLYYRYLNGDFVTFISSKNPEEFINKKEQTIQAIDPSATFKHEPMIEECRYNPNHDRGTGNIAFWVRNNLQTQTTWTEPTDPNLQIKDFPLWILLWGWEDYTRHITHLRNIDEESILVIRSSYLNTVMPNFVFLTHEYIEGENIYTQDRDDINYQDFAHWYPKWRYQKPAIENLLLTGPAVCKPENQKSIQAHMKYSFYFKWGGNPSTMETITDPTAQPTYPNPNTEQITHEIIDPTTSIQNYIYPWDVRRDILTKRATKRIKQCETDDESLFTDGEQHSPPQEKTTPQKKKAKKAQETPLLQQLQLIQQHNYKLQLRLRKLKTISKNL